MKFQDLTWIFENGSEISGNLEFSELNGLLVVNQKLALQLHSVSSVYSGQSEIEVHDSSGGLLGILCLCQGLSIDLSKMTEAQMVCYLNEIEKDYYGQPYQIQNNYFVLGVDRFENYSHSYLSTSFLWGGFVHAEHGIKKPYTQEISSIVAISNINLPTTYHVEAGIRGIVQPFAFERFLKFYHLLELLFDFDTVEKIKGLADDLRGVGQILSAYDINEVERLKYVIDNRCRDYDAIAEKLNGAFLSDGFLKKSKTIFFEFGKEHNPFKDEREQKFDELVSKGGFTEVNAKEIKLASNREQYEKLILNVAVYWLYRIRCSIAHNRIGEYVMIMDDEEFVVEFAEPLARELLIQAFTK